MSKPRRRLAILISGRGSNMQTLIDACADGRLDASVCVVLSSNPDAGGLAFAQAAGIPTRCVDHRDYPDREPFDRALLDALAPFTPDLVVLAGFMRILTPVFIEPYAGRLINVHPSLLPKYRGLHTHQRALDAGDAEAGVTVHFVTAELDGGPSVLQARVPVLPDDTADALAARVLHKEHKVLPLAVRWYLDGRLALGPAGVTLDGRAVPTAGIAYAEDMA